MKNIMVSFLMLMSLNSFANEKGNGGTVLVCEDRVVLADFEEVNILPRLRGKLEILNSDDSVETQIERAFQRIRDINPRVAEEAQKALDEFNNLVAPIEDEYDWTITPDIGAFPVPKGCELKNTVMYIDGGAVEMKMPLFRQLSLTHQAGIKVHEVVYKLIRNSGSSEGSAVPARRITAMLFAQNPDQEILSSLVTRYLAKKAAQTAMFMELEKDDFENDRYLRIMVPSNSYLFLYLNEVPLPRSIMGVFLGYHFKYGDTFSGVIRPFSTFDFDFYMNLMQNTDPKADKRRNKYQKTIKTTFVVMKNTYPYQSVGFFIGLTSPKMQKYMMGQL